MFEGHEVTLMTKITMHENILKNAQSLVALLKAQDQNSISGKFIRSSTKTWSNFQASSYPGLSIIASCSDDVL